jgi:hypothetical protein
MANGKRRIHLDNGARPSLWARLLRRRHAEPSDPDPDDPSIDLRLKRNASIRAVRAFVEAIETYQLHTRKVVHVVSSYVVPPAAGLQEQVPEWLAARVRFGVVRSAGHFEYLGIRLVDVAWNEHGTELFLHLDEKVIPGTRAFIAAWLGDESPGQPGELPSTLLLGEPS